MDAVRYFPKKYPPPEDVLATAPGPSPWYLRAYPPNLAGVGWEDAEEGNTLLKNLKGDLLAVIGMYCYVAPIDENHILVWFQEFLDAHSNKIDFVVLNMLDLSPINDGSKFVTRHGNKRLYIEYSAANQTIFTLPTDLSLGKHTIHFPDEFQIFDELLILGHSTYLGIEAESESAGRLCIFIAHPQKSELNIVPQDWFNKADLDFGYQWVTRVGRDKESGKVFGEGFRIPRFVLNDTLRNVEKWFDTPV